MRQRIQRGMDAISRIVERLQFSAPLLTRLLVGVTFFYTGRGKLANLDRTIGFFTDLGIPFPAANAIFISGLEFIGGICLILGVGTRVFAALLSSTMVVALMTAEKDTFVSKFPAELTDDVGPVVLLVLLGWLVLHGPGVASIDRIVNRWWRHGHLATRPAMKQTAIGSAA